MDREKAKSKQRKNLARRWAEDQEKSASGSCIQLPAGVEFFKLTVTGKDPHKLDFIPFLAGKFNPRADEGEEAIDRTYVRHWIPSMSGKNQPVACRFACFNKPCAVCDWMRKNGGKGNEDLVKTMKPQTRHLWIVNDKPGVTKNPTLKVLDTNDKNKGMGFAELISDACSTLGEDVDPFALVGGCTAHIIVKEQSGGDFKYNGATRIDLRERDYNYPEDMINDVFCLDSCVTDPGYDEVMRILEPKEEVSARSSEKSSPKKAVQESSNGKEENASSKNKFSFKEGDEVEYAGDIHTVKRVDEDGTLVLKDEEGSITKNVDPEECLQAPKRSLSKVTSPPDEEDDDEDYDDDAD